MLMTAASRERLVRYSCHAPTRLSGRGHRRTLRRYWYKLGVSTATWEKMNVRRTSVSNARAGVYLAVNQVLQSCFDSVPGHVPDLRL